MLYHLDSYFKSYTSSNPLVTFRVAFGLLILISIIRFWYNGWIESLYLEPNFHFSYFGFSWVKPLGTWTYVIFLICMVSSFFMILGYKYRLASVALFLSFTYIELMDKTTYLNHYYLVSLLSFMLIFLPAAANNSIDAIKNKKIKQVPIWTIDSIKIMLCIVYFYAGFAKINSDWLIEAQPLKIWLQGNYDIPIIGNLLQKNITHHLMSWGGMLYDCLIPFFLLIKRTRWIAFFLVVFFHILTKILFPAIGMFPYIMIISCIIFFDHKLHDNLVLKCGKLINRLKHFVEYGPNLNETENQKQSPIALFIILTCLIFQFLLPLRYKLYPGELFWTEQGYRFSWRVMLVEKKGYASFRIVDEQNDTSFYVNNMDYLTPFQEKQMSFQPDFILEFAHYLGDIYKDRGMKEVAIYVDAFATLNGRKSERLIDPNVNLYKIKPSLLHKKWINPYSREIFKL